MTGSQRRAAGVTVVVALVVALMALAAVADTETEIAEAERRLAEVRAEADAVTGRIEAARARQYELEERIGSLERSRATTAARVSEAEIEVASLAVEAYMNAASGQTLNFVLAPGTDAAVAGLQYLSIAGGDTAAVLDELAALRNDLERRSLELDDALAEQAEVTAELVALAQSITQELSDVGAELARLEEIRAEELRELFLSTSTTTSTATTTQATSTTTTVADDATTTTAPDDATTTTAPDETTTTTSTTTTTTAPPPSGGSACPVAGPVSFVDSWGAPRSGGRAHQGVDMIADRGTPIAAIFDGVITRMSSSSLGGITLWMRSNAGDSYYYAHLDGYASVSVGQAVSAGEIIAFNGSSGNAPDWLPHLHFEYHPGGGGAVNPYPLVKGICG